MPVPDKSLMRGLLHGFYWCDECLQGSLSAGGWPALSRTQSMIMINLSDGITRPSDLARAIGVSRQAIQRTLMEMEHDGFLHLEPDPQDGRAKIVRLSGDGKGIFGTALRTIAQMEVELKRRLGATAVDELRRILYADWGPVVTIKHGEGAPRRLAKRSRGSRWRKTNL